MDAKPVVGNGNGTHPAVNGPRVGCVPARNLAAACAYSLGAVTGVLFLAWRKYRHDPIVRFHAIQSILASDWLALSQIAFRALGTHIVAVVRPMPTFSGPNQVGSRRGTGCGGGRGPPPHPSGWEPFPACCCI